MGGWEAAIHTHSLGSPVHVCATAGHGQLWLSPCHPAGKGSPAQLGVQLSKCSQAWGLGPASLEWLGCGCGKEVAKQVPLPCVSASGIVGPGNRLLEVTKGP